MRFALAVRRLSTHGGTERFVTGFSTWLAGRGHAVDVWCLGADRVPEGVRVRALLPRGRGRLGRLLAYDHAARRIPERDYDGVIGFSRGGRAPLIRAGGGCHAAWMATRGWSLADAVERAVDRRSVCAARVVVVNSQMAGDDLVAHYGVARERLRLIRNGVDLQRFTPGDGPVGDDVLFLGSGFRRKGLDTALRVISGLPGVRLRVLGTDPHQARYERLAARLGIADRVTFEGRVDAPEAWLRRARALLLPTRYDPAANVVLEALASGLPVVTTARNGAAEILPEAWMGAAAPDDVVSLRGALERVLQTRGLRASCRVAAQAWPADAGFIELERLALDPPTEAT